MARKSKKLKPVLDTLEGLDEVYHGLYDEKDDGSFILAIEGQFPGLVSKVKLQEFRDKNIDLLKKNDKFEEKFADIDPDKYHELVEEHDKQKDKKMIDAGKLEELLEEKTEKMRGNYESQITTVQSALEDSKKENGKLNVSLSKVLIDTEISKEVLSIGVPRKGAMVDILGRANNTWKIVEGAPQPLNSSGDPIYGKDGKEVMTIKEWTEDLAETAPHLFEGSKGGGGGGGDNRNVSKDKISKDDKEAFVENIEKIAKGEVEVTD